MSAFPVSESDIAMLAERLREGTRGRYQLVGRRLVGDGYVEFEALQVELERRVTLRAVRATGDGVLPSRDRVRARVRLSHPCIVPVLEIISLDALLVEVTPQADDKDAWWTSRSLDGVSANDPARWVNTVVGVIRQVASALAFAHGEGIAHGAVRPECIRFTESGSICVSGFLTGERSAEWSPYVSPELVGSAEPTAAGDQYALGVLAYTLLVGAPPFADAAEQQRGASPSRLVGVSKALRDTIMRMIETAPDARFNSMDDVMRAIDLAIAGASVPDDRVETLDENVQFTVYRPAVIKPSQWYPMLAFAHLAEAREGTNDPDPVGIVEHQAAQVLEDAIDTYKRVGEDSAQPIPREGIITFVPEMPGVEFNPPRQSFEWTESVHRQDFRLRAEAALNGKTARGRLTVFHGVVILAEITLSIKVDQAFEAPVHKKAEAPVSARPYRKIFASYSHKDVGIVQQFEKFAATLGDSYLRDSRDLRSGEVWSERLQELMREADIVQLFWSWNSMASPFVRQEWEYALSLGRPNFVRPTYWEVPMPSSPDGRLPTAELLQLHFQQISAASSELTPTSGRTEFTREFQSPGVAAPRAPSLVPPPTAMMRRSAAPTIEPPAPASGAWPKPASTAPPTPANMAPPAPASAAPSPPRMAPPPSASAPRAGSKSRMIGRIRALAALAFVAVSITTVYNVRSSAGNPGDIPVATAPPPPPIGDPGGGSGSPDSAPPARGGFPDNPKAVQQTPPPTSIGRTPPVSVNEVVSTYQRDSAFADALFKGRQVEVEIADSATVTFPRRADRAFVQTNSRGSQKVYCQVRGFQSDRIVVSNCVLE